MKPNQAPKLPSLSILADVRVQHVARRSCPRWLRACPEDIGQIARLRVFQRTKAEPQMPVTLAYIRSAVRHAAIDAGRRQLRREELSSRYEPMIHGSAPVDPEAMLLGRELAGRLRMQLSKLPEARRQVVELYLDGHGVTEIAQHLGCSRKRVDNLVHRGLAAVRRGLIDDDEPSPQRMAA